MKKRIKLLTTILSFLMIFTIDWKVNAADIVFPDYTSKPAGEFCDYELAAMDHYDGKHIYLVYEEGAIRYVNPKDNTTLNGNASWDKGGIDQKVKYNSGDLASVLIVDGKLNCHAELYYYESGGDLYIKTEYNNNIKSSSEGILMNGETTIDDTYRQSTCKYNGYAYTSNNADITKVAEIEVNYISNGTLDSKITLGDQYKNVTYENTVNASMFKDNTCPDLKALCTIDPDSGNPGTCELRTSDFETPDKTYEFKCNYIGVKSKSKLDIGKNEAGEYTIKYPDGNENVITLQDIYQGKISLQNHLPSNACEDIFYSKSKNVIIAVANTKFADSYVKGQYITYSDLEHYCNNGKCNLTTDYDTVTEDGDCPQALRPAIIFIKKAVMNTLQIFVPILLILLGTIDMTKAVMAGEDKGLKDATAKLIRRIIIAIVFFFVSTIVNLAIGRIAKTTNNKDADAWKACWNEITSNITKPSSTSTTNNNGKAINRTQSIDEIK